MASEGGSGTITTRHDPAWTHCDRIPDSKNGTFCKYCGLIMHSGCITRFMYHLSHNDPQKNARPCTNVPLEVKKEIRNLLKEKECGKQKKAARMDDIRVELRKGIYEDEDDDEDGEDDMMMYPGDLDPSDRQAYRAAIRASKATEWERQQVQNFASNKIGRSSRDVGGPSSQFRRTKSGRKSNYDRVPAQSLYKSQGAKQRRIKDMFSNGNMKEKLGRLVSKFFIYDNVPPSKVSSHHFKNMIVGAQEVGPGVIPPTPYEIKYKYLDMECKEMNEYVESQKEKWKTYGCTIMADGWTGPTKLSLINFMVYCKGMTIFLKSVDSSNKIKYPKYIYGLLK